MVDEFFSLAIGRGWGRKELMSDNSTQGQEQGLGRMEIVKDCKCVLCDLSLFQTL